MMFQPPSYSLIRASFALTAVTFALSGCGGGDAKTIERNPVSGTVTLDGAPLDQGSVRFEPMSDVKERTTAGATITAGKYDIPKSGGLPSGKYMVSITSSSSAAALPTDPQAAMDAAGKAKPAEERIPARYNQNTELVVEIKPGANAHDFPLTSAKSK